MNDWASLPLRLGLGIMFFAHGAQKVLGWFGGSGLMGFEKQLANLGLEPSLPLAIAAGFGELICGVLLIIGLCTRISAGILLIIMITAIAAVHFNNGFFAQNGGFEYPFIVACACLALILMGTGKLGLNKKL